MNVVKCFVLLSVAMPAVAMAQAEPAAPLSVMELLLKGGFVMIPLALCSLLALTLSIERAISLQRRQAVPASLADEVVNEVAKGDVAVARRRCEEKANPLSRMFLSGLRLWERGRSEVETAMAESAGREIARLQRSVKGLKIIAAISPLLGLLGTVSGMIRSFQTVATNSGSLGRPEMLAQGIYEAMVTTAAGLALAIPALLAYFFLSNRVERIGEDLEVYGTELAQQVPTPTQVNPALERTQPRETVPTH